MVADARLFVVDNDGGDLAHILRSALLLCRPRRRFPLQIRLLHLSFDDKEVHDYEPSGGLFFAQERANRYGLVTRAGMLSTAILLTLREAASNRGSKRWKLLP